MTQSKLLTYHNVVVLNFIAIGGIASSVIFVAVLLVVVIFVIGVVMRYSTRNKSKDET